MDEFNARLDAIEAMLTHIAANIEGAYPGVVTGITVKPGAQAGPEDVERVRQINDHIARLLAVVRAHPAASPKK